MANPISRSCVRAVRSAGRRVSAGLAGGALLAAATILAGPAAAQQDTLPNDYPTVVVSDYVLGCFNANGQTRQALERCSCSIDTIATILPYDDYVRAETVLGVGQVTGQSSELFRSTAQMEDMVAELRRAQAEAEIQCFP